MVSHIKTENGLRQDCDTNSLVVDFIFSMWK